MQKRECKYYLIPKLGCLDPDKNLPYEYRIAEIPVDFPFVPSNSGVHLLSHLNKDLTIEKVLRDEDCNGIWEAEIKVYNQRRNKYYSKTSTFFPKNWTPSHFMSECFYAFKKIYNPKIGGCIESLTKSNIPVRLVFKNDELNSIYPIYEK